MPHLRFSIRTILWATALVAASVILGQRASVERRADLFIVLVAGSVGCLGAAVGSLFDRPSLGAGIAIVLTLAFVLLALFFVIDF